MKRLMYITAKYGTIMLTGCSSLEDRLASNDTQIKRPAERELLQISRATGTDADRVAAVNRISDKDYLYEIAMYAATNQWVTVDSSSDYSQYHGFQRSSDGDVRVYYRLTSGGNLSCYTRVSGRILNKGKPDSREVNTTRVRRKKNEMTSSLLTQAYKFNSIGDDWFSCWTREESKPREWKYGYNEKLYQFGTMRISARVRI